MRVEFEIEGTEGLRRGSTKDLSARGAYVETRTPPEVDDVVRLHIHAPSAWEPIRVPARVKWVDAHGLGGEPGFGARFDRMDRAQLVAIRELLSALEYED